MSFTPEVAHNTFTGRMCLAILCVSRPGMAVESPQWCASRHEDLKRTARWPCAMHGQAAKKNSILCVHYINKIWNTEWVTMLLKLSSSFGLTLPADGLSPASPKERIWQLNDIEMAWLKPANNRCPNLNGLSAPVSRDTSLPSDQISPYWYKWCV